MEARDLYDRIEKAIKDDETGCIIAAKEIAEILHEVDNPATVIRYTIVASRVLAWEANAAIIETRAQNMRQNAEALRGLVTG